MRNARTLLAASLLASLVLAGCVTPGPAPTPTATPAAPTVTPAPVQQQGYEALEKELASIPDLNASEVEQLLAK